MHGYELWKSDGTAIGTVMVSDITPGPSGSDIDRPTSFAGKLYFPLAENSILYLWSSDETAEGTAHVADPGITNVRVGSVLAIGNKIFLGSYTTTYGSELYVGTVKDKTAKFAPVRLDDKAILPGNFNVMLYPNPVTSKATLQIAGGTNNTSISITDVQGKTVWQSMNRNTRFINIPTERFSAGTYFVIVKNDSESKTIRFVKQ